MFCLNYYPFQKYLQDAEQLKIKYRAADRTLEDFLEKYKNKSIVIKIQSFFEETDAVLLKGLSDKYQNIKLIIDFDNKYTLSLVQEHQIPFFFSSHVTSIDMLHGLLAYNPTDMYICEELGFFLDKVSKILHEHGVNVRVYPNICQSSFPQTPSLKTFFIRPDDIPIYENFVDVFELVSDSERQRVLYRIYKDEKWFGKINEVIPSFKGELDNKYIFDISFGAIRSSCGKRCLYKPGTCDICNRFTEVAKTLEDNHIVVLKHKE